MRSVAFHPEAQAEFIAAARYYESQAENLGLDFISAVEATYRRLVTLPERSPLRISAPARSGARLPIRSHLSGFVGSRTRRRRRSRSPPARLLAFAGLRSVQPNKPLTLTAAGFNQSCRFSQHESW